MNKSQLVDALAERLGDRRVAASAVDGLLETIVDVVRTGNAVSLTGFGVFESRARAARLARNPRTGEAVEVPATTVPAFRPGAGFRSAVGGGGRGAGTEPAAESAVPAEPAPAKPTRRSVKTRSNGDFAAPEAKNAPVAKAEKPTKGGKPAKADQLIRAEPAKSEPARAKRSNQAGPAVEAEPPKVKKSESGKPAKDDKGRKARAKK